MSKEFNRQEQLRALHATRKDYTQQKVLEAIDLLLKKNVSINFSSVAKAANVSTATLYRNHTLRKQIEAIRTQQGHKAVLQSNSQRLTDGSKDQLIETLQRKIKKVELENKSLREQLKAAYAQIYDKV